jgi:hypothetical protein
MTRTPATAIAIAVAVVSVATMAIDHLIGNEDDGDDSWAVDPGAFFISTGIALALTFVLFRFVVEPARSDLDGAGKRALVYSFLAVLTLPLLFLALPFPFAGAAIALGLFGREGRRSGLATAAIVIGVLVVVLGLGGYISALV